MAETSILSDELLGALRDARPADILVGIPSFNNARTIAHVVRAVQAGLAKYFPDLTAIILNSDGGSTDGTPDVVRQASVDFHTLLTTHPLRPVHRIVTAYHGIPGKGSALRTVFAAAAELGVTACAVVDSDLRSITPGWVDLLVAPIVRERFDFVAPLYRRHKYDGTITNSIVYPLTRALYGRQVRQPIGGDFGLSGALAAHYLSCDVWDTDVARFGVDIWMTTTAITGGFQVCQSFLGAKLHDAKDPGADLSAMLTQVVGSVFGLMESHSSSWRDVVGSTPVPVFGFEYAVGVDPVHVNVDRMVDIFKAGIRDLASVWEQVLHPNTLKQIAPLWSPNGSSFRFPAEVWVRVVYDFAVAYKNRAINRDHLLRSLVPLYLGRTASFVLETAQSDAEEVEGILEQLCLDYERVKPYVVKRWES